MMRKFRNLTIFLLIFALFTSVTLFTACNNNKDDGSDYGYYDPGKEDGDNPFDYDSNAFSPDIVIDGILNDSRWGEEDVVHLGSWDGDEEEGGLASDPDNYQSTKTAIIKMFRGASGYHWGFEVRDDDVAQKAPGDGDNAIWSDNILVNFSTKITGSTIPMPTDYYLLVSAFGYKCFRTGAQAAGMWGDWPGIVDYEAVLFYNDPQNPEKATGYGIEIFVPYSAVGTNKEDPISVAFLRVDRKSNDSGYYEDVWKYNGQIHYFNTPNSYAIWDKDNNIYNYYDFDCGPLSVKGTVTDAKTGQVVDGVTVTIQGNSEITGTTDSSGIFILQNVPSSNDLTLILSKEGYLNGKISVSRDALRLNAGGTLDVYGVIIDPNNVPSVSKLTGTVNDVFGNAVSGVTVTAGGKSAVTSPLGSYTIENIELSDAGETITFAKEGFKTVEKKVSLNDLVNGTQIKMDVRMVDESLAYINAFGAAETIVVFERTPTSLKVYFSFDQDKAEATAASFYGFGVVLKGNIAKTFALTDLGTVAWLDYGNWAWSYQNPAILDIDVTQSEGLWIAEILYANIEADSDSDIGIIAFDLLLACEYYNTYSYAKDSKGNVIHVDGGIFMNLDSEGVLSDPQLPGDDEDEDEDDDENDEESSVVIAGTTEKFGNAEASITFAYGEEGLHLIILFDQQKALASMTQGFYGFGVNISAGVSKSLLLVNTGYLSFIDYGIWLWNYLPPSTVGIDFTISEGLWKAYIPYSLLDMEKDDDIGINAFDVFLGGTYYDTYNYMVDGEGNVINMETTFILLSELTGEYRSQTAETKAFGNADLKVSFVRGKNGLYVTFTFDQNKALTALSGAYYAFGVCFDAKLDKTFIIANTGNVVFENYNTWGWGYQLPSQAGITILSQEAGQWKVYIPYELLDMEMSDEIGIIPFDVFLGGGYFGLYGQITDSQGNTLYVDGGVFLRLCGDNVLSDPA